MYAKKAVPEDDYFPIQVVALLKQGSACAYSKAKRLYKIKTGARNATHLQLTVKGLEADFEKVYIDIIHSKENNIRKESRLNNICPTHKKGSMVYPLQALLCTSHSSSSLKRVVVEESNNKIRVKLRKNEVKAKGRTSNICLNLSFSCNKECTQSERPSSTILTRTYFYREPKRRTKQLSTTSISIQRIPDHTSTTTCNRVKYHSKSSNPIKCKNKTPHRQRNYSGTEK